MTLVSMQSSFSFSHRRGTYLLRTQGMSFASHKLQDKVSSWRVEHQETARQQDMSPKQ